MKQENLEKILSLIKNTEKENEEINTLISELDIPSRKESSRINWGRNTESAR